MIGAVRRHFRYRGYGQKLGSGRTRGYYSKMDENEDDTEYGHDYDADDGEGGDFDTEY